MPGPSATTIKISDRQRGVLEAVERASSTPQQLAERCRIVLLASQGETNEAVGRALGVDRQRVRRWRNRWSAFYEQSLAAEREGASEKDLRSMILGMLSDEKRHGAPARFTPEQVASIIALACEPPGDSGIPVSHWTPPELAREAVKRGIVVRISPRQVDRFLARRACDHTSPSIG